MKVSILVPVYGVEKYIERCAISLFEQTYEDLEYIFVDDCSPDRSLEILESVMERYPRRIEQVTIIHHEHNDGLGSARLTGLQNATGYAVMFVDSDDYLHLDAVRLLTNKMAETNADIIDGIIQRLYTDGSCSNMPVFGGNKRNYLKLILCQNLVTHNLVGRLYRKDIFEEQNVFPQKGIDYAEDYFVTSRLLLKSSRAYYNEVIYYYYQGNMDSYIHKHNLSKKNAKLLLTINAIVKRYYDINDEKKSYRTALQIGLLLAFSSGGEAKIPYEEMQTYCPYQPSGLLFRLCHYWLRKGGSWRLVRACYRMMRRIYCIALKFS